MSKLKIKINENPFFFKPFFGDSRKNPEIFDYLNYGKTTQIKNTLKMEKIRSIFSKIRVIRGLRYHFNASLGDLFFDISRLLDYVLRYHRKNSGIHRFWRRNKDKEPEQGGQQREGILSQGYRWVWEEVL
jgi:hypothetical protein